MSNNTSPWNWQVPVVDENGKATKEFLSWLQQQLSISELANKAVPQGRKINTGTGLTGGGDLTVDRTISLDAELNDLTDVNAIAPTDGQALVWKNDDSQWEAGTVAAGLEVDQAGSSVVATATKLNFVSGATITDAGGGQANITISGGGSGGGLYDISKGVPSNPTEIGDATKFAWTYNSTKGMNVKYTGGGVSSPQLAGWLIPPPATNFHVCFLALHSNINSNYYGTSVGFYNSANDKLITIACFDGADMETEFQRWSSYSSRNDIPSSTPNGLSNATPSWYHAAYDGTNLFLGMSRDGANPVWMKTTTLADWVIAVTDIFVGHFVQTDTDTLNINTTVLCYDDDADARVIGGDGGGGGSGSIEVDQDGTSVVAVATKLNFTGATVTDAGSGEATIAITGGSGIPDAPSDGTDYARKDAAWDAITKTTVGLSNVDNTSDVDKPVSTAQATSIATKVTKSGDQMTGPLEIVSDATAGYGLRVKPPSVETNARGRIQFTDYDVTAQWGVMTVDSAGLLLWNSDMQTSGTLSVPTEAYGSGWNGSNEVPTKDAVYDKIQTLPPDYSTGPCTIVLTDSAGHSATMGSANVAAYTKVGSVVMVSGTINWTSISSLAAGSRLRLGGLPYRAIPTTGYRSTMVCGSSSSGSFNITTAQIGFGVDAGNTFIWATKISGNNVDGSMVPADIGSSGTIYGFSLTYITDQ